MFGGDTAVAAMQYSYLPSVISYVVDGKRTRRAASTLFDTVYGYWSTLAQAHRPRLVVVGESLGVYGSMGAFSNLADLGARTDGALFVGPPNFAGLWGWLTDHRIRSSPERLPVYGDGQTVRFATSPADLRAPDGSLRHPKVVIVQHASDPIVWWSTTLIWRQPDWLKERRGPDVTPRMRWFPFLTSGSSRPTLSSAASRHQDTGTDTGPRSPPPGPPSCTHPTGATPRTPR
jgi:uncharacterized membrane protein